MKKKMYEKRMNWRRENNDEKLITFLVYVARREIKFHVMSELFPQTKWAFFPMARAQLKLVIRNRIWRATINSNNLYYSIYIYNNVDIEYSICSNFMFHFISSTPSTLLCLFFMFLSPYNDRKTFLVWWILFNLSVEAYNGRSMTLCG